MNTLATLTNLHPAELAFLAGVVFFAAMVRGFSGFGLSAGGMFIALYLLARQLPPRTMRGTLSVYLFGAGALGLLTHMLVGTMDQVAVARGLFFILPTLVGFYVGRALLLPKLEKYYRPFCLTLLLSLASLGLARTVTN
ncbi:hypothetical protein [Litoreibacter janthinus]|uniref:hypothetical protein n=1 Tax=Litoreibacter janthinus TaxID=670154 RepID=UPI000B7D5EBB|nr:hypothetical protein [Litoreibacter janthinus]